MCPPSWKLYLDDFLYFWFLSSSSKSRDRARPRRRRRPHQPCAEMPEEDLSFWRKNWTILESPRAPLVGVLKGPARTIRKEFSSVTNAWILSNLKMAWRFMLEKRTEKWPWLLSVQDVNQEAHWASQPLLSWKWPGRSLPWGVLVNLITHTLIGSHAPGQSVGWRRKCWKMKLSENDHASSVVPNTKRIVHVFHVPVVIMMRFVATNVCVAIATKTKRLLKRNGQLTSTTTSMSLQAERRKHRHFSARH